MNRRFQVSRADGRSNRRVLIDYVATGEPGRTFTYRELIDALEVGSTRRFTERDVQAIVNESMSALMKELDRTLRCVRGVGYRMVAASEHLPLAMDRKRRADVQLLRGVETLQHVKWDELTPVQRELHKGTLLVVGALYQQQSALQARQDRVEAALRDLTTRVDGLSVGIAS